MPKEISIGCKLPKEDYLKDPIPKEQIEDNMKGGISHMIKVGKEAPKFSAPAYYNGNFVSVDLEEYRGKWVLLCFYPGDFTFV